MAQIDLGRVVGPKGDTGAQGPYFTPFVSDEGIISWTNNGGLPNPESQDIKGEQGVQGERGYVYIPNVSDEGVISWSNEGGLPNPDSVDLAATVIDAVGVGMYYATYGVDTNSQLEAAYQEDKNITVIKDGIYYTGTLVRYSSTHHSIITNSEQDNSVIIFDCTNNLWSNEVKEYIESDIALTAFSVKSVFGDPAILNDGAKDIPVKSLSVTSPDTFALSLNLILNVGATAAVTYGEAVPRAIIFPAVGGQTYTVTSGVTGGGIMRIGSFPQYPKNGDVCTNHDQLTIAGNSISVTTGANDKWVLVQFWTNPDGAHTLTEALGTGFGISPNPTWVNIPIRRIGKNLCDMANSLNGYWNDNGTTSGISVATRMHTPFFPVVGGEKYSYSAAIAYTSALYICWFDTDCVFLSSTQIPANATRVAGITAPVNAKFVSVTFNNPAGQKIQFERADAPTVYEAFNGLTVMLNLSDDTTDNPLTTAYGNNDIYAASGNITVEYRVDPQMYISKVADMTLAAFPTDTVSGTIVSFSDGADGIPVKSLTTQITYVQDLHGYDNPWPAGGGKNLLPTVLSGIKSANTNGTWSGDTYSYNGVTFTVLTDAAGNIIGIKANGTASANTPFYIVRQYDMVITTENLWISGCPSGGTSSTYRVRATNGTTVNEYGSGVQFSSGSSTIDYYIQILNGYTASNLLFKPMVSASNDLTFAPYENLCPIMGWTETNISQFGLPQGFTAVDNVRVKNTIIVPRPNTITDSDLNTEGALAFYVEFLPHTVATYGNIFSSYVSETTNATRLIFNTNSTQFLINNASRANSPETVSLDSFNDFKQIGVASSAYFIDGEITTYSPHPSGTSNSSASLYIGGPTVDISYRWIIVRATTAYGRALKMVLVPCTNPDGVGGFYDIVNGGFFTTASATDIIANGVFSETRFAKTPTTYTVSWQTEGTVYGGTAEYIGGGQWKITPTIAGVKLGDLTWTLSTNSNNVTYFLSEHIVGRKPGINFICSNYNNTGLTSRNQITKNFQITPYNNSGDDRIGIKDDTYATATAFQDAMTTLNAQLVYELYTPTPFIVSGPDPLTLYGNNNVWSNTGDVTLNYRADVGLYIDKKINNAITTTLGGNY